MSKVTCANCGAALDDPENLNPAEWKSCECGSRIRSLHLQATGLIGVSAKASAGTIAPLQATGLVGVSATASAGTISVSVQSITTISDLLMQAIIVPGGKTTEGTLLTSR